MATEIDIDKLLRCLSLLTALRKNTSGDSIDEYHGLTTSHVTEFHSILSTISSIGIDVSEFFVPEQEVKPRVLMSGPRGTSYSKEKYIRKSLFLTKLDAIIGYLNMLLEEKPRKTGFHPPS